MKQLVVGIFITVLCFCYSNLQAQAKAEEELKSYYLVLLKTGPTRNQDSVTAAQIQKEHLENINRMAASGKLNVAGPFLDDGDMRGIFVFDLGSEQEVKTLVENDPAVKSGRLVYEVHPWMTQKGTCFK